MITKTETSIDPFHPLMNANSNRPETFYIEFDGFLCNRSLNVLINLLLSNVKDHDWFEEYPFINNFCNLGANDLYNITKHYNPYELLINIASLNEDNKKLDTDIFTDIKLLEMEGYIRYQQVTSFAFALRKLLQENCIVKAFIQKEYQFYSWEKRFIKDIVSDGSRKIELLEGPSFHAYSSVMKEVTTSFINHPMMIDDVVKTYKKEDYYQRIFLVRGNRRTLNYNKELDTFEYKDPDFTERNKERGVGAGFIFTESVDEEPDNTIILAG